MAKSEWRPAKVLSDYVRQLASDDDVVARNITEFLNLLSQDLGKRILWNGRLILCVREIEVDKENLATP